ncbi:preprotein translocase subunit SecA [Terrihabitans rhizophilus]|uniref:Protein translocase subunit SecA n=1 Tax=Terrihabitans rhizophilus TaxID=3092662 RepID=A0ABU4RNY1_9HYPH|nr:preprotein translocase subunit SecA [Terrihabitans sp. PJ23]MDX6805809.1 preprotein translocase subunit SecA [Terrihabitans sp. PJ23]
MSDAAQPRIELYAERQAPKRSALDKAVLDFAGRFRGALSRGDMRRMNRVVQRVMEQEGELQGLDAGALDAAVHALRLDLRRAPELSALTDTQLARAFGVVREVSGRFKGQRHRGVQIMGAFAMMRGRLAEMSTGEGKTLTATLAAGTAALSGRPVHVVTVNDYLARRDAELMTPVYRALGLSVGIVISGQKPEERRAAYACDITYCTNKELAFDYLRDRMVLGQQDSNVRLKLEGLAGASRTRDLRLRGLHVAIVDEADSVLVDEARTPLVISENADGDVDAAVIAQAMELAAKLETPRDYLVHIDERRISLTQAGNERVREVAEPLGGVWRGTVMREELARQALSAGLLFHRDHQYLVREGKVQIIDEGTGRVMPDRFWGDGLHQMIEHKEGCKLSHRRATIARMTYQRFFRRYRHLCGMSGTARQVAGELWQVYRLPVTRIPTHRPIQRVHRPDLVTERGEEKWRLITARVRELHERGCPVLIGTRTVAASEEASAMLTAAGLPHRLLNAAQDGQEAAIVSEAGQRGHITIATSMAGRGTDIELGPGVEDLGGLHVIMSERHDARRVDDQLAGRAGRQGQKGHFEAILSLDDPLMEMDRAGVLRAVTLPLRKAHGPLVRRLLLKAMQRRAERIHAGMRRQLMKSDEMQTRILAFSGQSE